MLLAGRGRAAGDRTAGLCRADGRVGRCSPSIGVADRRPRLALLTALPSRIIGLLENDLLQALPLYVFMGALLNRLPLADRLFRCGVALRPRSAGAPPLATAGAGRAAGADERLGRRQRRHALAQRGAQARRARRAGGREHGAGLRRQHARRGDPAVAGADPAGRRHDARPHRGDQRHQGRWCASSTPRTSSAARWCRPALFLVLCLIVAWLLGRRQPARGRRPERPPAAEWATARSSPPSSCVGLLAGVAAGYFYAVEAAAMGGTCCCCSAWLDAAACAAARSRAVLRDTMAVSGALFALFVAATTFTLLFRAFGTDRLLDGWVTLRARRRSPAPPSRCSWCSRCRPSCSTPSRSCS